MIFLFELSNQAIIFIDDLVCALFTYLFALEEIVDFLLKLFNDAGLTFHLSCIDFL